MGTIYNIQRFSLHDGPGIRTTVFLKGCPLRCAWCHNPESQGAKPQLSFFAQRCLGCGACGVVCAVHALGDGHRVDYAACRACGMCVDRCASGALEILGREAATPEILQEVLKDEVFYRTSGGGVTLSGGEPLMQADFAAAVLRAAREAGIHTAVETCGHAPWPAVEKLLPWTNLFLYDVKQMDSDLHRQYTGVDNRLILANLEKLCRLGANVVVRTPVIPGYNDGAENFLALAAFLHALSHPVPVEILPYNDLAGSKYPRLGMTYAPGDRSERDGNAPDALCALLQGKDISARVIR